MSEQSLEDRVEHLEATIAPMAQQVAEIHRALFRGQEEEGGVLVRLRASEEELRELRPIAITTKLNADVLSGQIKVLIWFGGPVFGALVGIVVWLATKK